MNPIANESAEEREDDMSSLAARFFASMLKRAASAHRETTLGSEVPSGKHPKRSGLNDEAQNSPTVVTLDSPEQASDALPTLEGTTQHVPRESYTSLENGILARGPLSTDNVVGEAPFAETVVGLLLSARQFNLAIGGPHRLRGPDRLVLNSSIKLMKWDHPLVDAFVPGLDVAQSIIDRWNPFNQRDTFVVDMRELYLTNLRIPVAALFEEYFVPFPGYLDKKSYQRVTEDVMYIRNHDFNETAEFV